MAAEVAESLLERLGLMAAPVDPIEVAATEEPLLVLKSGDYRNRFDGQLEYLKARNRFLLFYNTKYDRLVAPGGCHPRTRFSVAHELGHYFLDRHHDYLVRGGSTHGSRSEFFSHARIEREADAFAAALLMPAKLMRPLVNQGELSLGRIGQLAEHFGASWVSTAIRAIQLSHFPCALAGIRDGAIAWTFLSAALRDAGCYPLDRGADLQDRARAVCARTAEGREACSGYEGAISHWFRTYDRDHLDGIPLAESYIPVPSMGTLLVLLTADEDDLMQDDD